MKHWLMHHPLHLKATCVSLHNIVQKFGGSSSIPSVQPGNIFHVWCVELNLFQTAIKTEMEEQVKITKEIKIDGGFMETLQKGGIAAFPSSCTLKIRYEGLSDYFLKCCLGGLSTGHGADLLHRQISLCFYASWKTGPSASRLPNRHRCRTSPPEQVHPFSTILLIFIFFFTQGISVLGLALFQLHFIS